MLSDEVKIVNAFKYWYETNTEKGVTSIPDYICKGLLDLYNKEKEKNKELEKENLEIRDWKYVIDSPIDLDKLKELDLIKIKGKEYVSKDKIKAKIEEVKDGTYDAKIVLQSLLEKE